MCFSAVGEMWRKEQLLLQLPKHDTDITASSITSKEEKAGLTATLLPVHTMPTYCMCSYWSIAEFKKFDELRLKNALDIGDVITCPDMSYGVHVLSCFGGHDRLHGYAGARVLHW